MKKKKLKRRINGLENSLFISRNSTSMWHQECDVIEEKAKSLQAELDIARAELADAHNNLRSSKALENGLRQDYCIKNDALDEAVFKIKELEFALEASHTCTRMAQKETADAKSLIENLEESIAQVNDEKSALELDIIAHHEHAAELDAKNQRLADEKHSLGHYAEANKQRVLELLDENQKLTTKLLEADEWEEVTTKRMGCLEDKLTEANAKLANVERLYNASVEAAGGFQNDLNKALAELKSFRAQEARLNEARADLVSATRKWAAEYQEQRKDDVKHYFDDAGAFAMRFVQPGDGLPLESFSRGPEDLDSSGADGAGERGS